MPELRQSQPAPLSEAARYFLVKSLTPRVLGGTDVAAARAGISHSALGGSVAEIRIEEKKRGAPWMLILLLLVVAAIIGWWLWSNRSSGTETTGAPAATVVDSAADTTRTP